MNHQTLDLHQIESAAYADGNTDLAHIVGLLIDAESRLAIADEAFADERERCAKIAGMGWYGVVADAATIAAIERVCESIADEIRSGE